MSVKADSRGNDPLLKETLLPVQGKLQKCEIMEGEADTLKVDCNTPLETFFFTMGVLAVVAVVILVFLRFPEDGPTVPLSAYLITLAVAVFFFVLRRLTDIYYLLDRFNREIRVHRRIVATLRESRLADFDDVYCVLPVGRMHQTKSGTYWLYHLAVLLTSGKMIRLSDSQRADSLEVFHQAGERIAGWLNTRYLPGKLKCELRLLRKPLAGDGDLQWFSQAELQRKNLKWVLIIIALFIVVPIAVVLLLAALESF